MFDPTIAIFSISRARVGFGDLSSAASKLLPMLLLFRLVHCAHGAQPIPTSEGMSWKYKMTEEAGEGMRFSDSTADAEGKIHATVIYRLNGTKELDGKPFLEFEMHRAGRVTNTDLLTVDEKGIGCSARIDDEGEMSRLTPAQMIIAMPLTIGRTWQFDGDVTGSKVHQFYRVVGEEDVVVPAGRFYASHIHVEQTRPNKMAIDRWFVEGTGIIKDITATRSDDDDLVRRISLELMEEPKVMPRPQVKPPEAKKFLTATLSDEPFGRATVEFLPATPKIYARWQGRGLRIQAKIRVVWIAEEVADVAPPDYTIDEATTSATAPDSHGNFALSRPDNGWEPGIYRVEFYVDGIFADALKLRIKDSPAAPRRSPNPDGGLIF